jgi:nucleoside-diphosphate-sugar epimerase
LTRNSIDVVAVGGPGNPLPGDAEIAYRVDVGDASQVSRLLSIGNVDAVVHAAGIAHRYGPIPSEELHRVNVQGTRNVGSLAADLNAKHLVLISSVLVYGSFDSPDPIDESAPCRPEDGYAASKLDAERMAVAVCTELGMDLTLLRPAPIVGEGSRGNFARLIRAIDRGRFLWVGKGQNKKCIIYVGDVARAVSTVLTRKKPGFEVFNLAAGPVSMLEMVDDVSAALNRRLPGFHVPPRFVTFLGKLGERSGLRKLAEARRTLDKWLTTEIYTADKIKIQYGFAPLTSPREAIKREVAAYVGSLD